MSSKKIALLSDQHLYHDFTPEAYYDNVKSDIVNNSLADMVFFNGDFATPFHFYGGEPDGGFTDPLSTFQTEVDYFRNNGLEVDGVDGNHEWDDSGSSSVVISSKIKGLFQQDTNAPTISHTKIIGNNAIILLSVEDYRIIPDGGSPNWQVTLQQSVLAWFENELAAHQGKNIIVLCHYAVMGTGIWNTDGLSVDGPGTGSWGFSDTTSQAIKDLLNVYHVDIWFNGHSHAIPTDPAQVQSSTPAGYGGTTFIHLPSTAFGSGELFEPQWKYFELVDGSDSITVKVRDSQTQTWLSSSYNTTVPLTNVISLATTYRLGAYPGVFRTGASRLGYAKKFSPAYSLLVKNTETPANVTTLLGSMTPGEQKTVSVDLKNDGDCSVEYVLGEGETNILFSINNVDFSNPLKVTLAADAESSLWIQYTAPTNKVGASVPVEIPVSMMVLVERG